MSKATISKNKITRHVVKATWTSINKIARSNSLTVLYRDDYTPDELNESVNDLKDSWNSVNVVEVGDETQRAVIFELSIK